MQNIPIGLTFDDILIEPHYSDIEREEIDVSSLLTPSLKLEIPIISSPMDKVTDVEMAEMMGKLGSFGVIHRNMSFKRQVVKILTLKLRKVPAVCAMGVGDIERVKKIIDETGIKAFVIDNAHAHQKRIIKQVEELKKMGLELIVGNISTKQAAVDLINAGADSLKVGIGCGSICKTRVETGIGTPQLYALSQVVPEARKYHVSVIADGGLRTSGDICKALAIGSTAVMLGNMLAGTDQSLGEIMEINGKKYKQYNGMGSEAVLKSGEGDRYNQSYLNQEEIVPEGVEALVPYKGSAESIIKRIVSNIKSSLFYTGARNLKEFQQKAKFIRITNAGLTESHPHSVLAQ